MSANKKPRKAYRPRLVTPDTMALALHQAAKPPAQERKEVLDLLRQAIKALREGVATEHQWAIAAGAVTVALSIERQGIVRGLMEHLNTAGKVLEAIHQRATTTGKWARATLYYNELDALQTFLDLHTFQLDNLGRAEFLASIDKTTSRMLSKGEKVTVMHELGGMAA